MSNEMTITLAPARRMVMTSAGTVLGMSVKAMEHRIASGYWLEGQEYFRAPDGRIWVDIEGVMKWVEKGLESKSAKRASGSASPSKVIPIGTR